MKKAVLVLTAGFALLIAVGCGNRSSPEPPSDVSAPVAPSAPVSLNKADYPVFPDADAGADPSVPAEQGGKGIHREGLGNEHGFRSDRRPAARSRAAYSATSSSIFLGRFACAGRSPIRISTVKRHGVGV